MKNFKEFLLPVFFGLLVFITMNNVVSCAKETLVSHNECVALGGESCMK